MTLSPAAACELAVSILPVCAAAAAAEREAWLDQIQTMFEGGCFPIVDLIGLQLPKA